MSVIHEALKKIGEPVLKQPRIVAVRKKRPASDKRIFVLIGFILVGSSLFLAGQRFGEGPAATVPSNALGQFAIEETPIAPPSPLFFRKAPAAKTPPFVLNGIAHADTDSYCLINGLVLRQGQKVGGATVEKISLETVTLDLNGEKILLSS